jgi:hypothetical protein
MAEDDIHFPAKRKEYFFFKCFGDYSIVYTNVSFSIAPVSEMIRANVVGCWATSNPLGTSERNDGDDLVAAGSGKNLEEADWVDED